LRAGTAQTSPPRPSPTAPLTAPMSAIRIIFNNNCPAPSHRQRRRPRSGSATDQRLVSRLTPAECQISDSAPKKESAPIPSPTWISLLASRDDGFWCLADGRIQKMGLRPSPARFWRLTRGKQELTRRPPALVEDQDGNPRFGRRQPMAMGVYWFPMPEGRSSHISRHAGGLTA